MEDHFLVRSPNFSPSAASKNQKGSEEFGLLSLGQRGLPRELRQKVPGCLVLSKLQPKTAAPPRMLGSRAPIDSRDQDWGKTHESFGLFEFRIRMNLHTGD